MLLFASAPVAWADLSRDDPDDVAFKLDVENSYAFLDRMPDHDRFGVAVQFFDRIPLHVRPRVNVQYDAFGGPEADFALRYRLRESGGEQILRCRVLRLSDRVTTQSRKGDIDPRSFLCYMRRPGSFGKHGPVQWRLRAILPGRGDDLAPDAGWYPHA
jgi:hypothetical protein